MTTVRPASGVPSSTAVVISNECAVMSFKNREEALFVHAVLVGIGNGEVGNEVHR